VEVSEVLRGVPLEYGFTLAVHRDGDGEGVVLRRTDFVPTAAAGVDLGDEEARRPFREWLVQMRRLPGLRASGSGAFEELTGTQRAEDELFADLTEGAKPADIVAARLSYRTPAYRAAWFAPLRADWYRWSELWTGLPRLEGLDVTAELEVGTPYEEEGRTLVRLERKARVGDQDLGRLTAEFLTGLGASPSNVKNMLGFETVFRDTAVFDTATWLPVEVKSITKTFMRMETSRGKWREEEQEEHRYRFEWRLRDGD
jgi:hypothetical protein